MLDEMKIKSDLVFNKNTGELVGFTNLSQVNQDIEEIVSRLQSSSTIHTTLLAKKMLAFMVRPIFKPSIAFTIAAFPTRDLSRSQLFPLVWEVVESLEFSGFPVVAIVADGASPNR